MSMISEQIKTLQRIADRLETDPELDMEIGHIQDFWAKDIRDAIDIIETLSAKVRANNLHDGWIPCSERLPVERTDVLVTVKYSGFMGMHGTWIKTGHLEHYGWDGDCCGGTVVAWMPLPEPYKEN